MAKRTPRRDTPPSRGQADLGRLRKTTDREIAQTAPMELEDLPTDFWADAELVVPGAKRAVSLRVDQDVLDWFKDQGPRYQSRMNAVLRRYMSEVRKSQGRRSPSSTST